MAKRSHIVYGHLMRWEPLEVSNSEGTAWIKTFNIDRETGARSALIKYDPGFRVAERESVWPADNYIVDGEMQCGDLLYHKDTYHYRPAGSAVGEMSTRWGCTRLIFSGDDGGHAAEPVFIQDTNLIPRARSYTNPGDIEKGSVKILREDTEAKVSVLLSQASKPDMVLEGTADVHNHSEEVFVLDGEIEDYFGDVDGHVLWKKDMYVYRNPFESAHGDVLKTVLPQNILVRRGWTGNATEFYGSAWAAGAADSREGHQIRLEKVAFDE